MKAEPSLRDKVATLQSAGEIDGFRRQLEQDGRLTVEVDNLLALRRRALGGVRA